MELIELNPIVSLLLAFILGAIVGIERELRCSSAGVRTCALVALGSCIFSLISVYGIFDEPLLSGTMIFTPSRISAQVVSGVGFIGAGVVFKDSNRTRGITTAATIWLTAALGMAVAHGMLTIAIMGTFLAVCALLLGHCRIYVRWKLMNQKRRQRRRADLKP